MRILIAEDERITRLSLARQLESWGHEVVAAEDGQRAWELFQSGGLDLILTDWDMPRLSGLELIRRIRGAAAKGYVYLIMLTGHSDKADVVQGMEAGADDFVSKPFDREELRVRLLAGVRILSLEHALLRQNAELQQANENIHKGLEAAARVQRALLPRQNLVTPRVRTAWKYVPTEELAGDAIGLHLVDDRYLIAYVLDVSGHGVPAALLAVTAMHVMDPHMGAASLLRDMTASGELGTVQRPDRVATELNRRFSSNDHDGRYMTMILAVLDTQRGQLHLTSAGHPYAVILRGREVVPSGEAGGLPIAIMDDATYEQDVVQLQPGDRVYLFSDGLLEQSPPNDSEQFQTRQLLPLLQANHSTDADAVVTNVTESLRKWAQVESFTDDVSIVLVEWLGQNP